MMFLKKFCATRPFLALFGTATSACESEQPPTAPLFVKAIGSQQYVANKFIEDRIGHQPLHIGGGKYVQFVTVMDGHGGPQVAEYMTKNLPEIFKAAMTTGGSKSIVDALETAFHTADSRWFSFVHPVYELGFTAPIKVGACAIAIAVDDSEITVANVGDCKCVLAREGGEVIDLNIERNINNESEQLRLKQLHPGEEDIVRCRRQWTEEVSTSFWKKKIKTFYSGCYVKGRLQPTKSFGDFHLKDERVNFDPERNRPFLDPNSKKSFPYIDADPDITTTKRSHKDHFLIAATDGLWDQFSSQEAALIVEGALKVGFTAEQASQELVNAALERAAEKHKIPLNELKLIPPGSGRRNIHDDITVCIVVL